MKSKTCNRVIVASIVMMAIVLVVWVMSYWRFWGWSRLDETWLVIPASGMQELHEAHRGWFVIDGCFEASRTETLRAVIPAGSSATTEPRHESHWLWQPSEPTRVRSWDNRWHVTRWDEWRLGEFGWYESAGGGAVSRVFSVPLWMVMLVVGTPCWVGMARAARARRRRKRGLCVRCGYDRRGIAADSVCPECGAGVESN